MKKSGNNCNCPGAVAAAGRARVQRRLPRHVEEELLCPLTFHEMRVAGGKVREASQQAESF